MAHNIYDPSPSECEVDEVIASLIYYTGTFSELSNLFWNLFLKNSDHSLVEKSGKKNWSGPLTPIFICVIWHISRKSSMKLL